MAHIITKLFKMLKTFFNTKPKRANKDSEITILTIENCKQNIYVQAKCQFTPDRHQDGNR